MRIVSLILHNPLYWAPGCIVVLLWLLSLFITTAGTQTTLFRYVF
jgi:hypothetical protein